MPNEDPPEDPPGGPGPNPGGPGGPPPSGTCTYTCNGMQWVLTTNAAAPGYFCPPTWADEGCDNPGATKVVSALLDV